MLRKHHSILTNPLTIHLLIWTTFFTWLWLRQYAPNSTGISAGSISSWADGAAHLTYTSYLVEHNFIPKTLPTYAGYPFTYPFLSDLLTAILVKFGFALTTAHIFIGIALSTFLVYLLFKFYSLYLKNHWQAFVASQLFLLSGGLGFFWFFQDLFHHGLSNASQSLLREYTHLEPQGIQWINVISGELLPQRAFLLGLPLGLLILIFCYRVLNSSHITLPTSRYILIGLLTGLLPIIHPHTFIVCPLVLAWTFILLFHSRLSPMLRTIGPNLRSKKWKQWFKQHRLFLRNWLLLFTLTLTFSLPLTLTFILPAATSENFFRLYLGWMAKTHHINWFWFWLLNWGLFPFIALLGARHLKHHQQLFLIPFILLFIMSNLFLFQPYDWDNTKLLTYVYLLLAAPAALFLHQLWQGNLFHKLLTLTLTLTLTFSATLDTLRLLNPHLTYPMFTTNDLQIAAWVKQNTSPDAIFLTSDTHHHPIPCLAGRPIVMGYRGWLWTYGINYSHRELAVQQIYAGSPNSDQLIDQLHIDYIVIGPHEQNNFQPNQAYFNENFTQAVQLGSYTIYQTFSKKDKV